MSKNPENNLVVMRYWFDTVNENDVTKMLKEFGEIATEGYLSYIPGYRWTQFD